MVSTYRLVPMVGEVVWSVPIGRRLGGCVVGTYRLAVGEVVWSVPIGRRLGRLCGRYL